MLIGNGYFAAIALTRALRRALYRLALFLYSVLLLTPVSTT